jgi:PilZ domain
MQSGALDAVLHMSKTSVRIWGCALDGKTFHQNATIRSFSRTGACIEGVEREIPVQEVIALEYDGKRARVMVSAVDSRRKGDVVLAVKLLDGQCSPWQRLVDVPDAEKDSVKQNTRRYARYQLQFPMELWSDSNVTVKLLATDVCGNGCFIQTMATVCVGTRLQARFRFGNTQQNCECIVRTCDVGLGMGIEFTGLDHDQRLKLQEWLEAQAANPMPIEKTSAASTSE